MSSETPPIDRSPVETRLADGPRPAPGRADEPCGKAAHGSADMVEQALAALLAGPENGPGARLPTERALAERLNVARSAVRSALSRLEAQGKVVRIGGSGTYVAEKPAADADDAGRDASPQEIMDTRMLVEPRLASMVVANANGADMAAIREAMLGAEAAQGFEEFELWDGRFHQALADATHNRLMKAIYRQITLARDLAEWGELKRRSVTEERRRQYEIEHREIVAALQARDATLAETALLRHLVSVRRNLLGF